MNNNTLIIRSMIRTAAVVAALSMGAAFTAPALASVTTNNDAGATWLAHKYPAVYGPRFAVHAETSSAAAPEVGAGKAWLASKYPAVYGPRFNLHAVTSSTVAVEVGAGKAWLASKYPAVYGPRSTLRGE